MSILLVDPPTDVGAEVVTRLVRQGDEVRVIEHDPARASLWTRLGAHVARGDPTDGDLIERAATNCRTVVTFTDDTEGLAVAAHAARAARVERMIAVVQTMREITPDIEVIQLVARARSLFRKSIAPAALAAAIDAADDVLQVPATALDLADVDSWRALGLDAP